MKYSMYYKHSILYHDLQRRISQKPHEMTASQYPWNLANLEQSQIGFFFQQPDPTNT